MDGYILEVERDFATVHFNQSADAKQTTPVQWVDTVTGEVG